MTCVFMNARFSSEAEQRLQEHFPDLRIIRCELVDVTDTELAEVEAVLGWGGDFKARFDRLASSRLRWIQTFSAGVDSLDFADLRRRGIVLTNASGIHGIPIRETVFGMLLSIGRGLVESVRHQSKAEWADGIEPWLLQGKTMMIFGAGSIGQSIAALAVQGFGMRVIGVNRSGRPAPHMTETIQQGEARARLREADIVVGIMPLTDESRHYFDYDFFREMRDDAVFVNVGRGPSVVTADLNRALVEREIAWAALDVTDPEPLPADDPLWQRENLLISPHISGFRPDYDDRVLDIIIENLEAIRDSGQPLRNVIDYDSGY